MATKEPEAAELGRVAVRPPPFWAQQPRLWFAHLEAQFRTSAIIADATKYYTVVAALDSAALEVITDLITSPPTTAMYETIKTALITRLAESDDARLRRLLSDVHLGDRRPSDLLRHMTQLAGAAVSTDALRALWLQRLPLQAQAILAASNEALPQLADRILSVYGPEAPTVAAVTPPTTPPPAPEWWGAFTARLDALCNEVRRLSRPTTRARSASRSRKTGPAPTLPPCWYRKPCSITQVNQPPTSPSTSPSANEQVRRM